MSDDRPVSLAAAVGVLVTANEEGHISDIVLTGLSMLLRSLPPFPPATHGGLRIPEHIEGLHPTLWITSLLGANPLLAALYDYAYAAGCGHSELVTMPHHDRVIVEADKLATPPAPVAPKSVEEMAAKLGYAKCAHPTCEGYGNNTGECVSERTIIRLHAEHIARTTPPREMPAPKVGMVVEIGTGIEFQVRNNQFSTWPAVVRAELPTLTYLDVTRIYWPGPTETTIWERA